MTPALGAGVAMLAVLVAVFVIAVSAAGPGWMARIGRTGLVAVLLALGVAVVGVSLVLLPIALLFGMALLAAGLLLLAVGAFSALRARPPDRPRPEARRSDPRPGDHHADDVPPE